MTKMEALKKEYKEGAICFFKGHKFQARNTNASVWTWHYERCGDGLTTSTDKEKRKKEKKPW